VVTTADVDLSGIKPPPNVRIERFVPHTPVIERAACVVCHAGMGITQKALAHAVPVVAVPFGRDQPEVSRRVEVAAAGVRLPLCKLTADRLRAAVRMAMRRRSGAERLARAFAHAGGTTAAADALEELLDVLPERRGQKSEFAR
jgi:UDP:flavonoid glycosyltransferase YjiC (YdhE family)